MPPKDAGGMANKANTNMKPELGPKLRSYSKKF